MSCSRMYLQFFQSKTTTSAQFSVVTDGGATDNWAEGTSSWAWEHSLGFLNAILASANFTCRLVEPGFHMSLPPLVKVSIWNHIISLTHLCCLDCKDK